MQRLLEANGIERKTLTLLDQPQTPAVVALLSGEIDALVFASAPESLMVQMLLRTPGVKLFDFAQAEAYSRRFAFMSPVVLPRGIVDLARDLPGADVRLVAPTATLVAKEGTHPALVQLFVQAAQHIHGDAGWFHRKGDFPSAAHTEMPLAKEAERFYKSGAPLLQRYLPFWLANLIDRMWVVLASIIVILLPLSRIVPPLYQFRIRSRIFRWYAQLRGVEGSFGERPSDELLSELADIEQRVERVAVPLSYADELYSLRSHIQMVRAKLLALPAGPAAADIARDMTTATLPRVLIIGCGFGGLEAVRALSKAPLEITLIDRTNHHLFQPLLYQVATAGLSAPAISAPIRHTLRREMQRGNLTILQAEVTAIDAATMSATLDDGTRLGFEHLIVAAGATHSYFGHDAWARFAPGLKTLADAFEIRAKVIGAFEHAERCEDAAQRDAWLTFVIIGAGPTGVEMAGTMSEIAQHTLKDEFRRIDTTQARVVLIEGSERVLGSFVPALSARAREQLIRIGVDVRTGCRVTGIDAAGVTFEMSDGTATTPLRLASHTVIWAAGVAGSDLGKSLAASSGAQLDRAGRVIVQADLSVAGHPNIAVIGDLAAAKSHGAGDPVAVPGVSPAAKQMGRCAAVNLLRRLRGEPTRAFRYVDYGNLATIGRKSAVVDLAVPGLGALRFSGLLAWLFWLFAHIYFLIGFRNRLIVMLEWAWAYFTFERSARVVAQPRAQADT